MLVARGCLLEINTIMSLMFSEAVMFPEAFHTVFVLYSFEITSDTS